VVGFCGVFSELVAWFLTKMQPLHSLLAPQQAAAAAVAMVANGGTVLPTGILTIITVDSTLPRYFAPK
jgi:hypothetical protein